MVISLSRLTASGVLPATSCLGLIPSFVKILSDPSHAICLILPSSKVQPYLHSFCMINMHKGLHLGLPSAKTHFWIPAGFPWIFRDFTEFYGFSGFSGFQT